MKRFVIRVLRGLLRRVEPAQPERLSDTLPVIKISELIQAEPNVELHKMRFLDGNVSPLEVTMIEALVAERRPKCCFEIGTFNGNSTLQMAANIPEDGQVFTLDLPLASAQTAIDPAAEDLKYMKSTERGMRRFTGTPQASRIAEVFGDSATFDYKSALAGKRIDFAFIDGAHSYNYVKSDTQKIFEVLAPSALVLWHDYQECWPGVCIYLNELSKKLPLFRIEDTCIVCYRKGTNPTSV